ncbi:HAMP domain-containing sensor histidine kinase [Lysinibacillus sp. M3]|uniref:histidine kinase n=1 Tax=Lysinibacillus zambalensis TaxID=3160866 RepID=A0ABV1MM99_9BACI
MKWNSIVFKLGVVIMVLFLSILVPFAFFIDRIFLNVYSLYLNENIKDMANRLSTVASTSMKEDPYFYENITALTNHDVIFFNENGVIISKNVLEFKTGEKIPKKWLQKLQDGKQVEGERFEEYTYEKFYYVGQPIMDNNNFQGGVLIFSSIDEFHHKMHAVRDWIIRAIITAIVLALGYTIFLVWRLSRPLLKMEQATREIAKGNLDTRVQIQSNDEVGSLAKAINDLSVELNNYRVNRSELLANISHELRTPISYLKGYAQVIKNGQYENEDELKIYSNIIESESERLAKLIQELFELSKMEEGMIKLYVQSVDIEDLVESVVQKVQLKGQEKGLILSMEIEQNLPIMQTDGLRLEQILLNLLENAVNYTDKGEVNIQVNKVKKGIQFAVIDTGLGIPPEDLPFVFDRFHRVEKSRARQMGGTGLGLAIVAELVKHLQGEIIVNSKLGEGSEFRIIFPLTIRNESEILDQL